MSIQSPAERIASSGDADQSTTQWRLTWLHRPIEHLL